MPIGSHGNILGNIFPPRRPASKPVAQIELTRYGYYHCDAWPKEDDVYSGGSDGVWFERGYRDALRGGPQVVEHEVKILLFFLPAVGKENATFPPNVSKPGANLLEHPCRVRVSSFQRKKREKAAAAAHLNARRIGFFLFRRLSPSLPPSHTHSTVWAMCRVAMTPPPLKSNFALSWSPSIPSTQGFSTPPRDGGLAVAHGCGCHLSWLNSAKFRKS